MSTKKEPKPVVREYALARAGDFGYGKRRKGFVFATETDGVVTRQREIGDIEYEAIMSDKENFEVQ